MENQFTRMQKLAGLINEGYESGNNPGEETKQARDILKNAGLSEEDIRTFMLNNSFGNENIIDKAKEYSRSMQINESISTISKSDFKNMIREIALDEAKKNKKDKEETDIESEEISDDEMSFEEEPMKDTPEGNPDDILDALKTALNGAKALGDEKLVDQIGNTITFYTRVHIVGQEIDMD